MQRRLRLVAEYAVDRGPSHSHRNLKSRGLTQVTQELPITAMGQAFVKIIFLMSAISLLTGCPGDIASGVIAVVDIANKASEGNNDTVVADSNTAEKSESDRILCGWAIDPYSEVPKWWSAVYAARSYYIAEAKSRGFTPERCASLLGWSVPAVGGDRQGEPKRRGNTAVRANSDAFICDAALDPLSKVPKWYSGYVARLNFITEAKRRGFTPESCSVALERTDPPAPKSIAKPIEPAPILEPKPKGPTAILEAKPASVRFKEGMAAIERGDYAAALRMLRPLAEQGDVTAQYNLGVMYRKGAGVRQDDAEAAKWYRRAAEHGYARAQTSLGFMFQIGKGVPLDHAEAVKWYKRAAERGYAGAQWRLGFMYRNGLGVPNSSTEAIRWIRMAAVQGHSSGQFMLGTFYEVGESVSQSDTEAVKWYRKAAEQGHGAAQWGMSRMYGTGRGVPLDHALSYMWAILSAAQGVKDAIKARDLYPGTRILTPGQIAEGQRLARSWRPKRNALPRSPHRAHSVPRHRYTRPSEERPPNTALVRQRIARLQAQLASMGYDLGPADGVLGPRTRSAIRAFQAREGLPVTGTISERLEAALQSATRAFASKAPPTPRLPKKTSTGSGFIVSSQGHALTNAHVVDGCHEVRVAGIGKSRQIATDNQIDLALLKVSPGDHNVATFRDGRGVRTGEDIIVAGYPLHGLLSAELNVTKGTLSSVSGPGEDRRIIQITAPVQQGNSGGPVLDSSGNVVGVVRSKLNAIKFARATGVLPENINFAVSAGTARAFLDSHDVPYATARSDNPVPTANIAAKAKGYTVLVECWK